MRKQIALVSLLTIASQLAAFIKVWFTAKIFGITPAMDGYNLAIVLPTFLSGIAAGVLQTGLFPVRARINIQNNQDELLEFERSVILTMLVIGSSISLILMIGAPFFAEILASSTPSSIKNSLLYAFPFSAALVALNFVGDTSGFLLAMRNKYAIAAAAPVANGLLGAFLLYAWPEGGLLNLVGGTVLGLLLQVIICVWGLKSTGFTLIGALPNRKNTILLWREILSLGGWILPGVLFSNLITSLPPLWAAKYGEGAVSAFGYAYRLHSSALQLLVIASSTVILARFSDLAVQNDFRTTKELLKKAAIASGIIGAIALALVWTMGTPALEWLFGGRFDAAAAERVTSHWILLTAGLPFSMLGNVFAKLWQAQRKPQLLSLLAGISLLTFVALQTITGSYLEELSLSLSISAAAISVFALSLPFLKHLQKQNT